MEWKRRDRTVWTLEDLIERNTGMRAEEFLNPKKEPFVPGLADAAELAARCIWNEMPIKIVGDYDADGICGTAILRMVIEEASGIRPEVRIPKRFSEGYGLSMNIIDETDEGLLIAVDNGITAIEQIREAKRKGIKVIIIDHHLPVKAGVLPDADVIVDPHAKEGAEFKGYCGAALAYRFAKELLPDSRRLTEMLVLASIATVTDVVPLTGDNRNILIEGLEAANIRKVTPGLKVLFDKMGLESITEEDYAYRIGPVLNASGRLMDDGPGEVLRLLTSCPCENAEPYESIKELEQLAWRAIQRNVKRQEMVKQSKEEACRLIEEQRLEDTCPLVLYDSRCSEGIMGIVAGELAEEYGTPAIVFTDSAVPGILKGSGRTYGEVDLKHMLDASSGCLLAYGGHSEAAGMKIRRKELGKFIASASSYLDDGGFQTKRNRAFRYYDIEIQPEEIPVYLEELKRYAPYGKGNPKPEFLVRGFESIPAAGKFFQYMGKSSQHIKIRGQHANAIGFGLSSVYKCAGEPKRMDLIGTLSERTDCYGRKDVQIIISDFRKAAEKKTEAFHMLERILAY